MKKEDVCIVRARQFGGDYIYNAIELAGFSITIPYKDTCLVMRLLREIWFKAGFPKPEIWYNKNTAHMNCEVIVIYDPLITPGYIKWIRENNPEKRIVLCYENRADLTIDPESIDSSIEKWSYDDIDCKKYDMKKTHPNYYCNYAFDGSAFEKEFDVLYLGRDKGRIETLLCIENEMNKRDISTVFRICADRFYQRYKDRRYSKQMSYVEYLKMLKHARASFNYARDDQSAVTQRELECVFDGIKCITTNKSIFGFELYDESRFFYLNNNYDEIKAFLCTSFKPIDKNKLDEYDYETVIMGLLNN